MVNWCTVTNYKAAGNDFLLSCPYTENEKMKFSEIQRVFYTPVESQRVYFPPMDAQEDIIYKDDLRDSINRLRDIRTVDWAALLKALDRRNNDLFNKKRLKRLKRLSKQKDSPMAKAFYDAAENSSKKAMHTAWHT